MAAGGTLRPRRTDPGQPGERPPLRLVLTVAAEYRHLDGSELPGVLDAMGQVALVARELAEDATRIPHPRSGRN